EGEREPADLVALAADDDRVGELAAGHRVGALLEPADRRYELDDGERDDAAARAEQDEEEHQELLERPHHRLATAAVARIEYGDRAEAVDPAAPRQLEALGAAGELGVAEGDQLLGAALEAIAHVPRQTRRAHRPTADRGEIVDVVEVIHDGRL